MDKISSSGLTLVSLLIASGLLLLYHLLHGKYSYKISPIKIESRSKWEWVIILLMIVIVISLGFKAVFLVVVVSDSMVPEFSRGDMVLSQSIDTVPIVGDIITYKTPAVLTSVTHRVVRFDGERIRTKGDNSNNIDRFKTYQDDIISKVVQINGHPVIIPGLGSLFITDYSKQGALSRFGDQFTLMQSISKAMSVWGLTISIIGIILLISTFKR